MPPLPPIYYFKFTQRHSRILQSLIRFFIISSGDFEISAILISVVFVVDVVVLMDVVVVAFVVDVVAGELAVVADVLVVDVLVAVLVVLVVDLSLVTGYKTRFN